MSDIILTLDALALPIELAIAPSNDLSPFVESAPNSSQEQFLRFYLESDTTALLPISQLKEVLKIPLGQIVPIAHMPAWVMGVYNWQGEILWMVDLAQLVGLAPWPQEAVNASVYTTIVLQTQASGSTHASTDQMLGLVVYKLDDIEWCNSDLIQPPPSSSAITQLLPFLCGYHLRADGEMTAVLNGETLLTAISKL